VRQPAGTYVRVASSADTPQLCAQESLLTIRKSIVPRRKRKGTPQKRKSKR